MKMTLSGLAPWLNPNKSVDESRTRRLPSTSARRLTAACALGSALTVSAAQGQDSPEAWFEQGAQQVARLKELRQQRFDGTARNIIVFLGDGMGISTLTAARILEGQLRGDSGEENALYFERFPSLALAKTYNVNSQVPDSAGTMSAIATGIKTDVGLISVNEHVIRGDCDSMTGNETRTFLELAELKGLSTGVVSTARITHATPAANYAHSMDRDFEDDWDGITLANPGDCADIARQLIEFPQNVPGSDGLEVALGGGRRSFIPRQDGMDPETGGRGERRDDRDLTAEWQSSYDNAAYVWNKKQFDAINPDQVDHLLGLFAPSHMEYEADRLRDEGGEPTLSEMTAKAIEILSKNERGFYLNVEAGRIDHAHHAINPRRALLDTIELARAVETAVEMVDLSETLIIVTADHSHVFTIAGYPARGNPILGKVRGVDSSGETAQSDSLAEDGMPYTTLGYSNGPGHKFLEDSRSADDVYEQPVTAGRKDLRQVNTQALGFYPETLIPLSSETHGGEDVAIYATGAGSDLVRGLMEQHVIFHIMMEASQLQQR